LSSTSKVSVFRVVTLPLTVKLPVTPRFPPIVTSSGRPIVIAPADAETVTSLAVPERDVTPVFSIVRVEPSPPDPVTLIPAPDALAPAT